MTMKNTLMKCVAVSSGIIVKKKKPSSETSEYFKICFHNPEDSIHLSPLRPNAYCMYHKFLH